MPVKLTSADCGKVCVGQTGRCFTKRFEEHFLSFCKIYYHKNHTTSYKT
jgi:hypothetical protein